MTDCRTAAQLRAAYDAGAATPVGAVERALAHADTEAFRDLNALICIAPDAIEAAQIATVRLRDGDPAGPLTGVPVVVKDNIVTRDLPTTCASRILAGWSPPYESTAVARLRRAGAIVLAKANMDEFGMGSTGETSAFGPTKNPLDRSCVPGGSSSGSAAAVAEGIVPLALGSDTGGSIRQPASFCGLVGLKPTYGRVSRFGLVAFGSSFDQIGPIARTVADAAALYDVIAGIDTRDSTTRDLGDLPSRSLVGLRVAMPDVFYESSAIAAEVRDASKRFVDAIANAGAELVPVRWPNAELGVAAYYVLSTAEASSNLGRYDGVAYGVRCQRDDLVGMVRATRSEGFGDEVKRRIFLGTHVLTSDGSETWRSANRVRNAIRREMTDSLAGCDIVLGPTAPNTAFSLGSMQDDPLQLYLSDAFTVLANLTGVPALSVPVPSEGLPVGMQMMAAHGGERRLLQLASELEARGLLATGAA